MNTDSKFTSIEKFYKIKDIDGILLEIGDIIEFVGYSTSAGVQLGEFFIITGFYVDKNYSIECWDIQKGVSDGMTSEIIKFVSKSTKLTKLLFE